MSNSAGIPQVDFEVEELTVVVLYEGPARREMDPSKLQQVLNAHLRFNLGLAADGRLLTAGAVVDAGSEPRVTGLGFSRLPPEALGELIGQDPSVQAGVESYRVARYLFPKGSVSFRSSAGEKS